MSKHQAPEVVDEETPRWYRNMMQSHRDHIHFHEQAYGVPLGVLKKQPTQKELDDAYNEMMMDRAKSRMPKKKAAPRNVTRKKG